MKLFFKYILFSLIFISFSSCNQNISSLTRSQANKYSEFISYMKSKGLSTGNILVYEKIINGLVKIKKNFKIILIVGPYAKNHRKVFKRFNFIKNIKIISKPTNILNYLRGTKLFVSSAGVSAFESSALKLPTLLFQMNFNQNLQDFDYEKLGHYFMLKKK